MFTSVNCVIFSIPQKMKTTVSPIEQIEEVKSLDFSIDSPELEFNSLDKKIDSFGFFVKSTVLCFSSYFLFEVLM